MLRKLLTHGVILIVAAIPMMITLANFQLRSELDEVSGTKLFEYYRTMISEVASHITFLSITVGIIALSDYWDYRSDTESERFDVWLAPLRLGQSITVFFLTLLIFVDFILYYTEVMHISLADIRYHGLANGAPVEGKLKEYLDSLRDQATNKVIFSSILLLSNLFFYFSYTLIQVERKALGRLFLALR